MSHTKTLLMLAAAHSQKDPDAAWNDPHLVECLAKHQLLGRLETCSGTGDPVLAAELGRVRRRLAAQRAALAEIAALQCDPPVILIKGMGTLIGELVEVPRYSEDIDIVVEDPVAAGQALRGLGFMPCTAPDDPESVEAHEELWGYEFGRDETYVDIRATYPVQSYPPEFIFEQADPRLNPGHWQLSENLRLSMLDYPTMLKHSAEVRLPGGEGLFTPLPHLALLILCLDLFKDYAETKLVLPVATVRLGVLREAIDLRSHPEFSTVRFEELVGACNGHTAVAFTDALVRRWFGSSLSLPARGSIDDGHFPRDIWWDGFLIKPDEDPLDLIVRDSGMADLVRHLGCNTVQPGTPSGYTALIGSAGESLPRVIFRSELDEPVGVGLQIVRQADGSLLLKIEALGRQAGHTDILYVDFGDTAFEVVWNRRDQTAELSDYADTPVDSTGISATVCADLPGTNYVVTIPASFIERESNKGHLALILGVRRHEAPGLKPDASTLLPIMIEPLEE